MNKGFYRRSNEQLYDAKQITADRFVMGTCPKCGNEKHTVTNAKNVVRLNTDLINQNRHNRRN
jgi:methionyl-tRNA synthetase